MERILDESILKEYVEALTMMQHHITTEVIEKVYLRMLGGAGPRRMDTSQIELRILLYVNTSTELQESYGSMVI